MYIASKLYIIGRWYMSILLTVTCPFGVSGGSHVITIVDELNGRTCTLRGALSISADKNTKYKFLQKKTNLILIFNMKICIHILQT